MNEQQFDGNGLPGDSGEQGDQQVVPAGESASGVPVVVGKAPLLSGGNGRDAMGRFGPGNAGGPGRPPTTRNYHEAFRRSIAPEAMQEVFAALLAEAKQGNVQAATVLMAYGLGRPDKPIVGEGDAVTEEQKRAALRRIARHLLGLEPMPAGQEADQPDDNQD